MAFIPALTEALAITGKVVGPSLLSAVIPSLAVGSMLSQSHNTVAAPTATPVAQPGPSVPLRVRLAEAGIDADSILASGMDPLQPPPASGNRANGRNMYSREYYEGKQGDEALNVDQFMTLYNNEMALIAEFFQIDRRAVPEIPEMKSFVMDYIFNNGPAFTRELGQRMARDLSNQIRREDGLLSVVESSQPLRRSFMEAKSDYELKIGGPVTAERFAQTLAAQGVSGRRVFEAWRRTRGPIGGNVATAALFRRWLLDRVLPGAAASAVTFALERIAGRGNPGSAPPVEYTDRAKGGVVQVEDDTPRLSMETIQNELLDRELLQAASELDIGDEARAVIGSASWLDRLAPLPGSVQWTPNASVDTGLSVDPYPVAPPPPVFGDIITYPGDSVYTQTLQGDMLSERSDDVRARKRSSVVDLPDLPLPKRTNLSPELVIVPGHSAGNGLQSVNNNTRHSRALFPAIHENARQLDHIGSQTYDTTMAANVPSFVSPATSSAGGLYGRENRSYRNPLDSAPNVTGIGFDTQETERRLVEVGSVTDGSLPTNFSPDSTTPSTNPFANDQRSYQSREKDTSFVPVGDMSNPLFSNVGAQQPTSQTQPRPTLTFPLQ